MKYIYTILFHFCEIAERLQSSPAHDAMKYIVNIRHVGESLSGERK